MKTRSRVAFAVSLLLTAGAVMADGTESLGAPSIAIQPGTAIIANGAGMHSQPGVFSVEVPAGAAVKQVLLYWQGSAAVGSSEDAMITVASSNGTSAPVTGTLIGGPTLFAARDSRVYRADVTTNGLVIGPGITTLTVSDLSFEAGVPGSNDGVGALVIIDDGINPSSVVVRDGSDWAYDPTNGDPGPINPALRETVPQTFTFAASAVERTAQVNLFFASVQDTTLRPSALEFTTNGPGGGTSVLNNVLQSNNGPEWDTYNANVVIPPGTTQLTIEAVSVDNLNTGVLEASFVWMAAGFSLNAPQDCGRMTGGGSVFDIEGMRVTRGFEIHCDLRKPNNIEVNWEGNRFHLDELTAAICTDTLIDQTPPKHAPFDTFFGTGTGRYNGQPGARIEFEFVDAGEPGTSDTAWIKVYDSSDAMVLDVPSGGLSGYLEKGNLQTHRDNKCSK